MIHNAKLAKEKMEGMIFLAEELLELIEKEGYDIEEVYDYLLETKEICRAVYKDKFGEESL